MPINFPNRQSIRLSGYDYSNEGYYFITICTQNRNCIFGSVGAHHDAPELRRNPPEKTEMTLNEMGTIVKNVWETLPNRFPITLDEYQIMPNHIHTIIVIKNELLRNIPQKRSLLSQIIGYFKMNTTKQIRRFINNPNIIIWQQNYGVYPERSRRKHVIRNDLELNKIREYIKTNPEMCNRDRNNPASLKICLQ